MFKATIWERERERERKAASAKGCGTEFPPKALCTDQWQPEAAARKAVWYTNWPVVKYLLASSEESAVYLTH